jgi:SulP family sulfate permease
VEQGQDRCPQLAFLRVEGSLFFGAVENITSAFRAIDEADPGRKNLVVSAKPIGFSDRAGCEMLGQEAQRRRALGGDLWLVGVQPDLTTMMRRSQQDEVIGDDHVFRGKGEAIARIYPRLDPEVCRSCPAQIFQECRRTLPDGTPREHADADQPDRAAEHPRT